jgi:metallo-beta-lactamase family protein
VLIVGYQGHGSLGRQLVDKRPSVRIFGETIPVRASVHTFGGLSGHAGQSDLVRWIGSIAPSQPHVFLTHGEARGRDPLKRIIQDRYKLRVDCPDMLEAIEI